MAKQQQEKSFWQKLIGIDRRVIYLIIALAMILPFFFQMGLPIPVTDEVKRVYDYVEGLTPTDCVVLSADFSPSVAPELSPMFEAVFRHCLKNKVKVLVISLLPQGPGLVEPVVQQAARDHRATNGVDYAFLGYQYGFSLVIMRMMENIEAAFPNDYYGTKTSDLPVMKNIHNYEEIDLIVSLTGSSNHRVWLTYAHEPYNVPVAPGVTAVIAADVYPYLQSKQFIGMLGGLKGAAEYETLIEEKKMASMGMEAQNWAHIVIILFIIIGNIGFFAIKRQERA